MKYPREKTATSYAIDLTVEQLLAILQHESIDPKTVWNPLSEALERIEGVEQVEYNPHFGAHVFLSINVDHDNDETWRQVEACITERCS